MTESPVVFSIGAVLGDYSPENNAWKVDINALGQQAMTLRDGIVSPLCLNVVFHVDGKLAPNEFTGVRTGGFSKKTSHLIVQAAVPNGSTNDRTDVLLKLLKDAVEEAERFAQKRKLAVGLPEIHGIVDQLR